MGKGPRMSRVLITGASGFLGQALVAAAEQAGAQAVALSRRGDGAIDLGDSAAVHSLTKRLEGVDCVIHAAASFTGDAAAHARDTIGATDHVVSAMEQAGAQARLVLVSSLSVYDVATMADGATLTESAPLVTDAAQRDSYAAAKAAQERALQHYTGPKQIFRPGAIYGPHRLWSAQLGFAKAGRVITPGGDAHVPAIEVTRAARAIVKAALTGQGGDIINLIDPDPPTQGDWLAALGLPMVRVPRGLVLRAGALLGRGPAWQARFRPLRYDTTGAEALLEPETTHSFAAAVASAKRAEQETP